MDQYPQETMFVLSQILSYTWDIPIDLFKLDTYLLAFHDPPTLRCVLCLLLYMCEYPQWNEYTQPRVARLLDLYLHRSFSTSPLSYETNPHSVDITYEISKFLLQMKMLP